MKELSIEQKAKRYDEAINRMKHYVVDEYGCSRIKVADVFPELMESEDERIRKWLIYYFKEVCDNVSEKEKKGVLAWIEKQGKTSPILSNSSNIGKVEHKPAFEMKTPEESLDIDSDTYSKIVDECVYGEQKPDEWSYEDRIHLGNCIALIQRLSEREANWLKHLEERYTLRTSDKHYELEEFAKIVRCNLTGISKAVQKLFEAKYLQLTGNKMYRGFKD